MVIDGTVAYEQVVLHGFLLILALRIRHIIPRPRSRHHAPLLGGQHGLAVRKGNNCMSVVQALQGLCHKECGPMGYGAVVIEACLSVIPGGALPAALWQNSGEIPILTLPFCMRQWIGSAEQRHALPGGCQHR